MHFFKSKRAEKWRPLKRQKRAMARLLGAIVRRGHVEPIIMLLVGNFALSGVTLLFARSTPVLNFPGMFGAAYLCLASVGGVGLVARDHRLKAAFGFLGLFLRLWMAIRFCVFDWQNIEWCSFVLGAVAFGWIAARSACRHVWIEARRGSEPFGSESFGSIPSGSEA